VCGCVAVRTRVSVHVHVCAYCFMNSCGWAFSAAGETLHSVSGHGDFTFAEDYSDHHSGVGAKFVRDLYEAASDTFGKCVASTIAPPADMFCAVRATPLSKPCQRSTCAGVVACVRRCRKSVHGSCAGGRRAIIVCV
jgi:hypothetical protein